MSTQLEQLTKSLSDADCSRRADAAAIAAAEAALEAAKTAQRLHDAAIRAAGEAYERCRDAATVSLASPYTGRSLASPHVRLDPFSVFDKMQTARTTYFLQDADLASPFVSGQWTVDFSDEFPNTNYTVLVSVEDPNASFSSPAQMYLPGQLQKTTTGVKGRLTCPFGNAGRAVVINVIAVAD